MRISIRRVCFGIILFLVIFLYQFFQVIFDDRFAYFRSTARQLEPRLVEVTQGPTKTWLSSSTTKPTILTKTNPANNLWPSSKFKWDDRIASQLSYIPSTYNEQSPIKVIYLPDGETLPMGQAKFREDKCLVSRCELSMDGQASRTAAAVVMKSLFYAEINSNRPAEQVWVYYQLESPINTASVRQVGSKINWTATYRWDSTLVTPYEKFVPFANMTATFNPLRNFAKGKTKLVAWFVSNCGASNHRKEYVDKLQEFIPVDIYGACGPHLCPRTDTSNCFDMLSHTYKFYLSFENSNCQYYITEKLFWNALKNDVVPVVMGARKMDYYYAAPPNSFIHVEDFPSPKELASFLLKIDTNDDAYNSYMAWKGRGHFINTKFWCRLCTLLHTLDDPNQRRNIWYGNLESWWRGNDTCTAGRWGDLQSNLTVWL